MAPDEEILVVPRARLLPEPLHGFVPGPAEAFLARIRRHAEFQPRAAVEQDPSLKQVIPYLLIRHRGSIFLFQRSAGGGEARLHGKYSIGVGGHINRGDAGGGADPVAAGLRRELVEELAVDGAWRARLVGVLNDDTSAVGQVHFGLVHVVEVDSPRIAVRETGALSGRLVDPAEARRLYDRMETWSQLILDAGDPARL